MDFQTFLALLLLADIALLVVAALVSNKVRSQKASNAIKAAAIALVFAPGVVVGHGILPFPAAVAIMLQPSTIPFNSIPLLLVFAAALRLTPHIRPLQWVKHLFSRRASQYDWTCHVCGASNGATSELCKACGYPPSLTGKQINEAKSALNNQA